MKTEKQSAQPEADFWANFGKQCGFCYDREHGKHGEVKREWSTEYNLFIPVCRKHSFGGVEGFKR